MVAVVASALLMALLATAAPAFAGQASESKASADNGTDPTRLRRAVWLNYERMEFGESASRDRTQMILETPISAKTALRVSAPLVRINTPAGEIGTGLGDITVRAKHLLSINRSRGLVVQADITADTASERGLGGGATVASAAFIYAKFLPDGSIFAPAISHDQSLGGKHVSETTADFYFVPKLRNPAWYMTLDPALVRNWDAETFYGSFAVTVGRKVADVGAGVAQLYVKPNLLIGADRPANGSVEVGIRVIGF